MGSRAKGAINSITSAAPTATTTLRRAVSTSTVSVLLGLRNFCFTALLSQGLGAWPQTPFLLIADGILPDQFHALGIADPSIWPRGLLREADIGVGDRLIRLRFHEDRGRGARIGGLLDRFIVFWLEMGGFWWELVGLRQNMTFSGQIMLASDKIWRPQTKLVHLR